MPSILALLSLLTLHLEVSWVYISLLELKYFTHQGKSLYSFSKKSVYYNCIVNKLGVLIVIALPSIRAGNT